MFILDAENIVRYVEIVPELSSPVDYEKALRALKTLVELQKAA